MVIFVGNLSSDAKEQDLQDMFKPYGQVGTVNLMRDEITQRVLGFAFLEMPDEKAGRKAVTRLNHATWNGATLIVCETTLRVERRQPAAKSS